jgi:uncharacterized protein (TIGR02466 family)
MWATPILTTIDEKHIEIKNKAIEQALTYYKPNHVYVAETIKNNLYESEFDFFDIAEKERYEELVYIKHKIESTFKHIFIDYFKSKHYPFTQHDLDDVVETDIDIETHESWVHISDGISSYHGTHNHPNSSWSAIYCLEQADVNDDNGGIIQFNAPFDNMYTDNGLFFQSGTNVLSIEPKDGAMFFFPSNIKHSATPYTGDRTRIIISVNMKINIIGVN